MKIRNGFVSNSSSSSFIIGLGFVENEEKLKEFLEKNNIPDHEFEIQTVSEIKANHCGVFIRNDHVINECDYSGHSVSLDISGKSDDTKIAILEIHNNEGDCDEELIDAVYHGEDLSPSYFSDDQAIWLSDDTSFEEMGIKDWTSTYGCARNG